MDTMSKEARRQLQEAAEKHQLTHLERALPGSDELEGFVVEVTPSWTVIAECNRLALDGFVALRTRDIVKVRRQGPRDLMVRWLQREGPWPPPGPHGPLAQTDFRPLVESVSRNYHLIAVFEEDLDPGVVYIGAPVRFGKRRLKLLEVNPKARWASAPTSFHYDDITRIDFGDRYNTILDTLAGPPPR
ncbi:MULTISPECIES: hypothetical protein [unclassified Streptomyces]|uniref:hypothetical protein n=1 Tax=unclassified Streptomyces TaxID=2593676 RepID=UPI000B87B2AD|nr:MULTISPECIES: hypothetical protein [unclassified Streptomyces]MYT11165.1 hypothetical protein [Streptomyces sp. SID4951]